MGGRPTGKLDIGALLDEAARANEALRSAAPRTDKAADRQPEAPAEAKPDESAAPDITSELIRRYSERVKEPDPRSSTQSLRDSLHAHMEDDRELLAYYSGRSGHRSGKVDELYEIIKSAKSATESDARVRPVPHDVSRFRDASEVELPEQAEQGKLFPLTETIELGDPAQEPAPSYDEDYKKLSEKIEKGELDFNEETENEGQISIVFVANISKVISRSIISIRRSGGVASRIGILFRVTKIYVLGNNIHDGALITILVGIVTLLKTPHNNNHPTLGKILANKICGRAPCGNVKKVSLSLVTALAYDIPITSNRKAAHRDIVVDLTYLGIAG